MGENSNDLLLCTETKNLCFDDLDSLANDDQKIQEKSKVLNFDYGRSVALIDLLPCLSEESFSVMLEREKVFLPKDDYLKRLRIGDLDLNHRREAVNWIWKVNYMFLIINNLVLFISILINFMFCINLNLNLITFGFSSSIIKIESFCFFYI